ncbi:MAG: hypothetical protein P8X89_05185 [Reinekea sp.]
MALVLALQGCSTTSTTAERQPVLEVSTDTMVADALKRAQSTASGPLYKAYASYLSNQQSLSFYFSPDILEHNLLEDLHPTHYVHDWMTVEASHVENIETESGCLSINGFNSYNDPLTLSLTFVNYDGHWVIDYRLIDYLNDETEFSSKARCLR